jgi:uncharacterized damage-inducible protein DinB
MTDRVEPPSDADEKTTVLAYLDFQRATLAWKCENLSSEQLARRAVPTSALSLLGLVRHLAEVERGWFDRVAGGEPRPGIYFTDAEPDLEFDGAVDDPAVVAQAFADWHAEIDRARQIAERTPLEATFFNERRGVALSHRWVLLHMIEEYARHNGHADLLREAIDGATGE